MWLNELNDLPFVIIFFILLNLSQYDEFIIIWVENMNVGHFARFDYILFTYEDILFGKIKAFLDFIVVVSWFYIIFGSIWNLRLYSHSFGAEGVFVAASNPLVTGGVATGLGLLVLKSMFSSSSAILRHHSFS